MNHFDRNICGDHRLIEQAIARRLLEVTGLDLASGPDVSAKFVVHADGSLAACASCGQFTCGHSDLEFAGIVPAGTAARD